ncbi:predicted protein [Naegleria gruberi]|uniref:Predicted protein n=1 Tax=Naegleria gruberi TaxID=5762 RepID=D2V4H2_NAEGR|nr:uncharacterized protein NAEGRDRAFT_46628 [Naegleria gruberi]EFC48517.1 predicted protein [Naegleria gruberi]|eukprot:XP_002681261.1 predicted protein [Naegleria gruberi strain NEG-M]
MSLTLSEQTLEQYKKSNSFQDLIALNIDFIRGETKTTPYTNGLQLETSPLIGSLVSINGNGLLTTNSAPGINGGKAYLIGLVEGQSFAEKLEVLLNQSDLIAFKLPCNLPGYKPGEEDHSAQVDLVKIPVSFKKDSETGRTVVNRCVTCFNWVTLLQPCVSTTLYEHTATHCFNFYIIDPVSNRSALAEDGILNKVNQLLEKAKSH